MKVITSRENSTYKQALKLLRKKSRDDTGQYLLEGTKPLRDALEMGLKIEKIFVCEGQDAGDWLPEDQCIRLPGRLFSELADTVHSQGVIAVAAKPAMEGDRFLEETAGGSIIVLDRLQDPGNAGTIIRTAEAAGFGGVLSLTGSVDLYAPKVVRSAAGSLLRMPALTDVTPEEALRMIRRGGWQLVATDLEESEDFFRASIRPPCGLIVGNEGAGVSRRMKEAADLRVRIPMSGQIESLNAAVAAGILMYQIRQTGR